MKRPTPSLFKYRIMKRRLYVQLCIAVVLAMSGIALIFMSFWVDPTGIIDSSVLVAFGEVSTFSGALFGVDYKYALKHKKANEEEKGGEE